MAIQSILVFFLLAFIPAAYPASDYNSYDNIPCIIYLKGTSSAGKSTLIQSISQRWEDLEIVNGDAVVIRTFPEAVAKRFPFEYEAIRKAIAPENLYHAIRMGDILFNPKASEEECRRAELALSAIQEELNKVENLPWRLEVGEAIRKEIFDSIKQAIDRGQNVLLDSWYYKADEVEKLFPDVSTLRVMLYCPFSIAYERLLKRNREAIGQGNLLEKRYLVQLMNSFCFLYQLTDQPSSSFPMVNRQDLEEVFAKVSQNLEEGDSEKPQPIFSIEEITQSKFRKLQAEFMEPFERLQCDNLYIVPKEPQDLIIDNTFGNVQNSLHAIDLVMNFGKHWKEVETLEALNDEAPQPVSPAPQSRRAIKLFPSFAF